MGKWACKCGFGMNDHVYPDENLYRVFTDKRWDELNQKVDAEGKIKWEDVMEYYSYDIYRCPNCGNLMVFGDDNISFSIDTY